MRIFEKTLFIKVSFCAFIYKKWNFFFLNLLKKRTNSIGFSQVGTLFVCFLTPSLQGEGVVPLIQKNQKIPLWTYIDFLEDPSGKMTVEEISDPSLQGRFQAFPGPAPNFGISNSAFWVRFTTKNENPKENWMLEVDSTHIHSIDLYSPAEANTYTRISTGNQYPFSTRELKHEIFTFPIDFPEKETTYYIRFQNTHDALFLPISINPSSLLMEELLNSTYYYGLYYGILMAMFAYNLFVYISIREKSYFFYIVYLFFFGLHMLKENGLAYKYLWPESPEWNRISFAFTIPLANIPSVIFTKSFLETKKNSPKLNLFLNGFIGFQILVPLLVASFQGLAATIEIVTAQAGMNTILLFGVGLYLWMKGIPSAGFFLLAWTSFLIGGLTVVLMNFNVIPYTFVTAYGLQIGSALESTLLSLSLANKLRIIRKEKEEAQNFAIQKQIESIASLKEADRLKDEFLANTSHELKTPLNSIIGLTESILTGTEGKTTPKMDKNLKYIIQSGKRLNLLINDILDLSKIKNNQLSLNLQPVNIKNVLQIVLFSCEKLIQQKPIQLIDEIPKDTPLVLADEDRLQQILFNLIGNAVKFTNRGEIRISAFNDEGSPMTGKNRNLVVSVSDTGIGIPQDKLRDVFNSFEQLDGSIQRQYGGTGLGLTITKKMVELHGGKIWADSYPGEGSTFYFTLDLHENQLESITQDRIFSHYAIEAESKNEDLQPVKSINSSLFTLLLIDDEPINIQILRNHLSPLYNIISCMDGYTGLNILYNQKVDLVLLDLMMPNMSGYEVTQNIRKKFSLSALPILILTAKNQIHDIVDAFQFGANDYLTKPFSKDELLSRIKTQLDLKKLNESLEKEVEERTSELEASKKKVESLTSFTRLLNEQNDMREIFIKISEYVYMNFGIETSCLFLPMSTENKLEVFRFYSYNKFSPEMISSLENMKLDLNDPNELIAYSFMTQKNIYLNSKIVEKYNKIYSKNSNQALKFENTVKEFDRELAQRLQMKSILVVPLIIQKQTIGVYAFTSTNKEIDIGMQRASDLYNFCRHLSGSINSIRILRAESVSKRIILEEKAKVGDAMKTLKETQNHLIDSNKKVALGQLVTSVAHEINTPLGAIKANTSNMSQSLNELLKTGVSTLRSLEEDQIPLIGKFIEKGSEIQNSFSTKEERILKKDLLEKMKSYEIPSAEYIADMLIQMKISTLDEEYLPLWKSPGNKEVIQLIYDFIGLKIKKENIDRAVEKTSKVIFALKKYANAENSTVLQKTNITEDLENILTLSNHLLLHKIQLVRKFEPVPELECYHSELTQVWTHLLYNSLQAMEGSGTLTLHVGRVQVGNQSSLRVAFQDTGIGISESDQNQIFEPFFTTKKTGEGTGLGLYISKQIVEKHMGSIHFESRPGSTIFTVLLPFAS